MDTFTGRILYQINLSHQNLSSFLLITCPLLVAFSVEKALFPNMSSYLLIAWLYRPNTLSKDLCYLNTSSFPLATCPLLTAFPAKKAFLPCMSSFILVTCPLLAPFSIIQALIPHRSFFC